MLTTLPALSRMRNLPIGKWLLTLVGLQTMGGAYDADWNQTHLFNPR